MSKEEEVAFLAPFLDKAANGGILIVGEIKQTLEARLDRRTALTSTYNFLHRHNRRKLAPDKRHPKATSKHKRGGKKLPELLAVIDKERAGDKPLQVIFQDKVRFARISDTRRCWCPRPVRPMTMAMVTEQYNYTYASVSGRDGMPDNLIPPHVNSGVHADIP